jgi:serine/threonine protein kinase
MAIEQLPNGKMVGGRYQIRRRVGIGGMGTVYKAKDMRMGTDVALKVVSMREGVDSTSKDKLQRFAREIVAVNEVRHRNILTIQDFGFDNDMPFMVMEFLDGQDLKTIMLGRDTPLDVEYAADIAVAVCAAITACHQKKIIHRDLKPGNIMIVKSETGVGWEVKVVDFGISKSLGASSDLTQEGKIVGTPQYLAPEQLVDKVLPESDQYAIGLLLYYFLTRRHPYQHLEGLKLLKAIEKGEIPPLRQFRPDLPEKLEEIVMKAVKLNPTDRHASVFAFGHEVLQFASASGRHFWQRYYDTPPMPRPQNTAMMSTTTGISLVRQMAEGKVGFSATTVRGDYQAPTVVMPKSHPGAAERTLKEQITEDEAPTEVQTNQGIPEHISAPMTWVWSDSQENMPVPAAADADASPVKRRRYPIVTIAAAAILAVAGAVVANRSVHRSESVQSFPAPSPVVAAPTAAARTPVVTMPSTPPPRLALPAPSPVAANPVTARDVTADKKDSPAKKTRHHRSHETTGAPTASATRDPDGNLVPPP